MSVEDVWSKAVLDMVVTYGWYNPNMIASCEHVIYE